MIQFLLSALGGMIGGFIGLWIFTPYHTKPRHISRRIDVVEGRMGEKSKFTTTTETTHES